MLRRQPKIYVSNNIYINEAYPRDSFILMTSLGACPYIVVLFMVLRYDFMWRMHKAIHIHIADSSRTWSVHQVNRKREDENTFCYRVSHVLFDSHSNNYVIRMIFFFNYFLLIKSHVTKLVKFLHACFWLTYFFYPAQHTLHDVFSCSRQRVCKRMKRTVK